MPSLIVASLLLGASALPPPTDCAVQPDYIQYLSIESGPARQGGTLRIRAVRRIPGPGGADPDPCARDWRVSHPRAVTLAKDHQSITIAEDAPAGETVTISYASTNGKRVEAMIRIIGSNEVVLTGIRSQTGIEDCQGEPVREIEFTEAGRFSVTYQPFETYKDYWGGYTFDPATGALALHVEGGNALPPEREMHGSARFDEGGKLHIEGLNLGRAWSNPEPGKAPTGPCRYTFG